MMAGVGFCSPLSLDEYVQNGVSVSGEWVVDRDLIYHSKAGDWYAVPRGFITDLASIPKALRWLIDVNGKHRRAAVLHDYLYCSQITTREEADALFLEAMGMIGVDTYQRNAMWSGVRAFGWRYWNKRTSPDDAIQDYVPDSYFSVA